MPSPQGFIPKYLARHPEWLPRLEVFSRQLLRWVYAWPLVSLLFIEVFASWDGYLIFVASFAYPVGAVLFRLLVITWWAELRPGERLAWTKGDSEA